MSSMDSLLWNTVSHDGGVGWKAKIGWKRKKSEEKKERQNKEALEASKEIDTYELGFGTLS